MVVLVGGAVQLLLENEADRLRVPLKSRREVFGRVGLLGTLFFGIQTSDEGVSRGQGGGGSSAWEGQQL